PVVRLANVLEELPEVRVAQERHGRIGHGLALRIAVFPGGEDTDTVTHRNPSGQMCAPGLVPMPANDVVRLVTLAPGHFHAALVQTVMLAEVDPLVHVYAPPGDDLDAHLDRLARFNSRADRPTAWTLDVHADPGYLGRFLAERPGNTV